MCVEVLHLRNFVAADEQSNVGRGAAICSGRRCASIRPKSRRSWDFGGTDHQIYYALVCIPRLNQPFGATNVLRISPRPFVRAVIVGRLFRATGTSWNLSGNSFETCIQIYPAVLPTTVQKSDDGQGAGTQPVCGPLVKSTSQLQPFSAWQHREANHEAIFEDSKGMTNNNQLAGQETQITRIISQLNLRHAREGSTTLTSHSRGLMIE